MPFLLGLTGNIACGKSTVGEILTSRYGVEYIDADRVVHALYAPGSPQTKAIAARFGDNLLLEDGTIDRRRLGDLVLGDPPSLRALERILDPAVRRSIEDRIEASPADVVVLDAIRLIEGGLYKRCDAVWVVVCDPDVQVSRLQNSRDFSQEQASLRVSSQSSVDEKLPYASAVITNNGGLEELTAQIDLAWTQTVLPGLSAAGGLERSPHDEETRPSSL